MAAQASAKAPQKNLPPDAICEKQAAPSRWQDWKQVVIGEVLNVLEHRRYDASL